MQIVDEMSDAYMQKEPKRVSFFSTGYEQLNRSITMLMMVSVFIVALGKMIDSFFLQIISMVIIVPITMVMTVVDYRRLVKKRIEKARPKLLIKLLVEEAVAFVIVIIIYLF